jgi:hypothetical protein
LQGLADNFYDAKQLLPETFKKVCEDVNHPLNLRMHEVSTWYVFVDCGTCNAAIQYWIVSMVLLFIFKSSFCFLGI